MLYISAKFHSICTSCRIMAYIFLCITFLLLETDLPESDVVAAGAVHRRVSHNTDGGYGDVLGLFLGRTLPT